jgi:hypothetical protein
MIRNSPEDVKEPARAGRDGRSYWVEQLPLGIVYKISIER